MIQGLSMPNLFTQAGVTGKTAAIPALAGTIIPGQAGVAAPTQELGNLLLDTNGSPTPLLQFLAIIAQLLLSISANSANAFSNALAPTDSQPDPVSTVPSKPHNHHAKPSENQSKGPKAHDKEPPQKPVEKPQEPKPTKTDAPAEPGVDQSRNVQGDFNAAPPADAINVKDFGAKGDGVADDQAAIQSALNEAKASGKSVWLPPGTYNHSGVLTIDGTQVSGAGNDTVLHATNPQQGAVKLTGDGSSLSSVKTTVSAPNRSSMPDAAAVLVQNASNATVTHVTTEGASSNGIRLDNATGSKIRNNLVLGTNADGIALMNGSSDNLIQNNVVYQAGDDSYSDDSYHGDARQDQGNTFDGNVSLDNAYGRGITLAGSKNATVKNNIVSGSKWIGIWGDTDPNSGTMESAGHRILNNMVINSPNGAAVQANGPGTTISGTQTSGSVPSLASILGWDPGALPDRYSFNPHYQPGTGSGANNTAGNRS